MLAAVVDLVRPVTTGPGEVAAAVLGAVALAVVTGALVLSVMSASPARARWDAATGDAVRTAGVVAAVAAMIARMVVELARAETFVSMLGGRRVLASTALAATAGLLAVAWAGRVGLRDAERRLVAVVLTPVALGAMVLAGPRSGAIAAFLPGLAAVTAAVVLAAGVLRWVAGRPRSVATGAIIAALLVGWPAAYRPAVFTSWSESVPISGGGELLVTIAPARPGNNEVHIYVTDATGSLVAVEGATLAVDDGPQVSLTDAGIGHMQSLRFPLTQGVRWKVTFEADAAAGRQLIESMEVQADG